MPVRLSLLVAFAAVAFLACSENSGRALSPSPTSTVIPSGLTAQPADAGSKQHTVTMMDACDPDTFNAAIGPGTCTRSGGITFANFLDLLGKHHSVGPWHFAPTNVTMKVGQTLVAINRGGEEHTFTEVDEFGGGVVPVLNQLAGLTSVAPECGASTRIAPGASSSEEEDEEGVEKYQCCIHPWMRAEVRITEK